MDMTICRRSALKAILLSNDKFDTSTVDIYIYCGRL